MPDLGKRIIVLLTRFDDGSYDGILQSAAREAPDPDLDSPLPRITNWF